MGEAEYLTLSKELQKLAKKIPLKWGRIQNNKTDNKINMFNCQSLISLENEISSLPIEDQQYFKRRWFLWKCAQIDEYLFYKEENVTKNPNYRDQAWDIKFNNSIQFDVKGTVVPKSFRQNVIINEDFEKEIIKFYYENQSKGVRNNIQNRLFLIHHSFYKKERSMYLRCYWDLKERAFSEFNNRITTKNINLIEYNDIVAKCIFLIETKDKNFDFKII